VPSTQHIWLQEMQRRMRSAPPAFTFETQCGSANLARTMLDRVGMAAFSREAAFSGVRIWLSDWTRMCFTLRLISAVSGSVSRSPERKGG